jgi:hypothetical protein
VIPLFLKTLFAAVPTTGPRARRSRPCSTTRGSGASAPRGTRTPPAAPLVQQLNNGNWLPQQEAESLRDELFYQRAVHAYMTMLPARNTIGMRDGSEATFGKVYHVLPIWKDRMDARTWVPRPMPTSSMP